MRSIAIFLITLFLALPLRAEQADSISAKDTDYRFRPEQLVVPAAMIGAGALFINNGEPHDDKDDYDGHILLDNVFQYVPTAAYLGLGAVGVPCKHRFTERLLVGATAYVAMAAMTQGLKHLINEPRPFTEETNSFPSGHTATSFMGAELLRIGYGNYIGAAGYACGVAMGCMRIVHGCHWFNDVVAGAGIGILSARIGYWMLPLYRKWFRLDKASSTTVAAIPYYAPGEGGGVALNLVF